MKLLVVRHGRAGTAASFAASGHSDDLRPLTVDGRKRMRRGAKGLRVACPRVDVLGTSPLARAVETAQIVARAYGNGLVAEEVPSLAPGSARSELLTWLREQPAEATVGLVGHEPDLSRLVGWLLSGDGGAAVELKKGGRLSAGPAGNRGRARQAAVAPCAPPPPPIGQVKRPVLPPDVETRESAYGVALAFYDEPTLRPM